MSQDPSSHSFNIPNAHRAHILQPTPPEEPTQKRVRKWFQKPVTWLITLIVGGLAAFGTGLIVRLLDTAAERIQDPIMAYDVVELEPPLYTGAGYVVPGVHDDLTKVKWGDLGTAEGGGTPSIEWLDRQGAIPSGWAMWEVTLEGKRSTDITIDNIYPDNISCSEPSNGTYFIHDTEGVDEKIPLVTEIDHANPEFKEIPKDVAWNGDISNLATFSETSTIVLEPGKQTVISLMAHASSKYCEWTVAIDYTTDGKRWTSQITPADSGRFALTGLREISDFEAVVFPFTYCSDFQAHVLSGQPAQAVWDAHMEYGGGSACV